MLLEHLDKLLVIGVLIFFGILEVIAGHLNRSKRKTSDWIQEVGGFFMLSVVIKPLIVLLIITIGVAFLGQFENAIYDWSFWILLPLYLFVDDFIQYWYHRSAHEYPFLWKLHRPHHQAEEMGFFVSYRNAALYYVLMPNIWWIGIITFLGAGKAVAVGLILKQLVIIGSHSTVHWDKPVYKLPFLSPLMSVLERIIVTPAFHHAHHGKSKVDGISDPNANFGNMFSIWDQLFGSAVYTRKFPMALGLENDPKEHWTAAYLYPIVKSEDPKSELSKNFQKHQTSTALPITVHFEKGKNYLWCKCGKSKNQPFCDSSHHGTKFKPVLIEAKKEGRVSLCNCKLTKKSPFCDGSHNNIS